MNEKDRAELGERFDSTDLSDSIESAIWETDVDPDPMIVTSLRLPKSLLDWVRELAALQRSVDAARPSTVRGQGPVDRERRGA